MTLQERIRKDFARKNISRKEKNTLRIVLGEMQRQQSKELADEEVVRILKKLLGYAKEVSKEFRDEEYIRRLESYLPGEATEDEIVQWITDNIDFGRYRNKIQAMKDILAHFGARADGDTVKDILLRRF